MTEAEMIKIHLSHLVLFGIVFILTACQTAGQRHLAAISQPGDRISTMSLTTGVSDAAPLWSFCLPTIENDHLISVRCRELDYRKLAIGHTFGVMDLLPEAIDPSELNWELYLDGHPIDLGAFGTYDFVHPDIAASPSPIREVFRKVTVWDVVLVNPTPGEHTLRGLVRTEADTYIWHVNFAIRAPLGN
jgi:hypothetical protein